MKSINETLENIISDIINEAEQKSQPYNFIISLDKDYKSTDDAELNKFRDPKKGRRAYVDMVCNILGIGVKKDGDENKGLIKKLKSIFSSETSKDSDKDILRKYNTFIQFVEGAWEAWIYEWEGTKDKIPFRFNGSKRPKIARAYDQYRVQKGWPASIASKRYGYITIKVGNGLGSGQKGLKLEDDIYNGLCQYMANDCSLAGLNVSKPVMNALIYINDSELKNILKEVSKDLHEEYANLSDQRFAEAIKNYINKTGASNTKRNVFDIIPTSDDIYDGDEDVNPQKVKQTYDRRKNILNNSGNQISDITIVNPKTNEPTYLSIKDSSAQLSGVIISPSRKGVNWMDNYLDDIEDDESSQKFKQFWTMMGLVPDGDKKIKGGYSVKQAFKMINPNATRKDDNIELAVSNKPSKMLGDLIQRLIGGNYWYISPKKCIYISNEPQNWTFKADEAYVTATGRTINIKGTVNNIPASIIIRTSDVTRKYPNRMFPKLDVEKLLNIKGEEIPA